MYRKTGVRLADGHDLDIVYIDMRGQGGDPENGFGNVLSGERLGSAVNGFRFLVIAMKADIGKFGAAGHARLNVAGAYGRAEKIGAQIIADLVNKRFGAAVYVTAQIRPFAGGGADIDNVAALSFDHSRQQGASAIQEAIDIGTNHLFPIVERCPIKRLKTERQTGIVDQNVDTLKFLRQFFRDASDIGTTGNIER